MQKKIYFALLGGLTVLISVLVIFTAVNAGSLTPLASPAATSFTFIDIYNRLTTNATAVAGAHSFAPGGAPAGTLYTLTQIYNAIPTIDATKVLSGTTYLGIAGTAYGDTSQAKVLTTAAVAGTYNASNLSTATVKSGTAFGVGLTGALYGDTSQANVLTTASAAGTYNVSNLSNSVIAHGITWGVSLGSTGTLFGDTNAANVLTTATYPGTYNVTNLSNSVIKQGTTWGASLGSTGTLTPDGGTATVANLFNGKTANLTADWNLDTGTLNLACNTVTFDGTANLVADAYDGGGNGTNRWCMTDSGTAVAANILSGKIAWVNGVAVTGAGNVYTYGDNSAAYVLGTASAPGTALKNLFNGTGQGFTGGSQASGGVDDYNNGSTAPVDTYAGTWTACVSGNSYCGTSDSDAAYKDNSTGLIWSMPCNGTGCTSFSNSSPATYSWDNSAANNSGDTASQLCATVHAGWSLPHQKQLMQAYIDGSYGNLEASGVTRNYWSATTRSRGTTDAWYTDLSNGYTGNGTETNTSYVRCVR